MNIKSSISYIELDIDIIKRCLKLYINKWLDESQKIRAMIWKGEQSNRNEIYG